MQRMFLVCGVIVLTIPNVMQGDNLKKSMDITKRGNKMAAASQEKIDSISDETTKLLDEYRNTQQQIDSLMVYNKQVEKLLADQQQEIDTLHNQIQNATMIGRQITPLMLKMITALEQFIALDVPFLEKERSKRIADLKHLMDRSDVTESEKYRRLMEAFQVENEYGRTIEAYKGNITIADIEKTVSFLRIGRVSLVYLTLDNTEAGFWNQKKRVWEVLPGEYRSSIKKGLRIAQKQTAPDLIRMPVVAAEVMQ